MRGAAIDRLLARVDRAATPGCWTWAGGKTPKGYGIFRVGQNHFQSVHRFSYEHHKGPIPDGLHIDHLCRNRACVNPDHLEAVTPRTNALRGVGLPAQNSVKTHCPQSHPYEGDNLLIDKRGSRNCRACRQEQSRRRWAARNGAAA